MKRTQIYLDEDIFTLLEEESRMNHVSISEIIRQSIHQRFESNHAERMHRLNSVFGIWQDRDMDVSDYVRNLRRDRRHDTD